MTTRAALVLALIVAVRLTAAPLTIVDRGQPRACIILQPTASQQLTDAVEHMQRLIQRASGAKLPVVEKPAHHRPAIHIGHTSAVEQLDLDLKEVDDDGFVITIDAAEAPASAIVGPTQWGTEFGVYEFLERFVGVRWLMPGPHGTYVPKTPTIEIPNTRVSESPAFFSRKFFGLRLPEQRLWARRNRLHSRVEFHHQLYKLFPRTDIQKHPQFFPIHDGERYFPPKGRYHSGWQPCFTAPGIVDTAVQRIVRYFDEHPQADSYSLGVSDGSGHCECEDCRGLDAGRENMIGKKHLTDRYIAWANAVAKGVLKEHPDKWFGFLAYSEIFEPPDRVEMHPRLIPYMTYDRMQWADSDARAASQKLTKRWAEAAATVGWYDYIYGAAYLVPRVYPHLMGEYYRFGHENGVRCLTAEAYPNFGEGPKLYVSLKLQWDPYQDVDALLDEWCRLAVGEQAALYVRKYYDHWEDFWTRRILDSDWYSQGRQYLRFYMPTYLQDVTAKEIAQCREWLETAVKKAGTDDEKARAKLILRAFEYYEASALAYPRRGPAPKLARAEEAVAYMEKITRRAVLAEKRRRLSEDEFKDHPFLHHCMDIDRYSRIAGTDWVGQHLWTVFDWASRSQPVRDALESLTAENAPENIRMHARTMLATLDPKGEPLNSNPSFEDGDGARASGYSYWLQDGVGKLIRSKEAAHDGEFGIIAKGVQYGGPHQSVEFAPGRYCLVASLMVPQDQPEGAFVDLSIRMLNEANRNLPTGATVSVTPTGGQWHTVATVMDGREPPEGAVRIRAGVWARQFPPNKIVYIDDMRLIRLAD